MASTINCAVESCDEHPTENVIHHVRGGEEVAIPVCADHVSDVSFGLQTEYDND